MSAIVSKAFLMLPCCTPSSSSLVTFSRLPLLDFDPGWSAASLLLQWDISSYMPCFVPPSFPQTFASLSRPSCPGGGPAYTGAAGEKNPPSDKEERAGQRRRGTWVCSTTPRYELCGTCPIHRCSQEKFWSTTFHCLLNQTTWTCSCWLVLMWSRPLPKGWFQPRHSAHLFLALLFRSAESVNLIWI